MPGLRTLLEAQTMVADLSSSDLGWRCYWQADKMEYLEKEMGWREEDFDLLSSHWEQSC
jgi:hypothetical protein